MLADLEELSREELIAVIVELRALVAELQAQNAELIRRLNQDSSNSSCPPSTDSPFKRPTPKSSGMRRKSGRRPGRQPGDPGTTRRLVDDPDETIVVDPRQCADCGACLADAPVFAMQRRQVVDVPPPPKPKVTEYRIVSRCCAKCMTTTAADAPAFVKARMQFGPRLRALMVSVNFGHHVPVGRTRRILAMLTGVAPSTGAIVATSKLAVSLLEPFMDRVKAILGRAGLLHVDESPVKTGGGHAYVHVACDERFTAMHVGGRTKADIDAGGILPDFTGVLVRDGYSGYTHLSGAFHVWCGAHTLRDLKALHDADPDGQLGATAMADTLLLALEATHAARAAGRSGLDDKQLAKIRAAYAGAIARIRDDNRAADTDLARKARSLADRFERQRDAILAFIYDLSIPFTNNRAEIDIRGTKIRQRVSGCWRTLAGLADFAVIWSYLSTATKHGRDHLDVLTGLFRGEVWLPPEPATG